ncbi:hypothetical protein ACIOEX_11075 [Streptomyces sp. NPDC087850]|uniref:hypothetical protein n=1 Tax=Streptomyces sp. NPDC087850 TaxID=3365809 RepID=UPI003819A4EC
MTAARPVVCGARIHLTPSPIAAVMTLRSDIERVLWDATAQPRCVLASHPPTAAHWGIARLLPHDGADIWAVWNGTRQPHAIHQWPTCTARDRRTGERCDCPRAHRGQHGYAMTDYYRGLKSWRPLAGTGPA